MDDANAQPAALEPGPIPLLTAVMVMPRSFSILRASLACLRRQSIHEQIELVLVHTPAFRSTIDLSDCKDLCSIRLVEIDRVPAVAGGFAAGAAAASAPIVAFVEDHVFLHPQWAERVVEAHRQPCAAVVPKMTNANPATVWSRANFLVSFSEAFAMDRAGPVESGPGHNTSYKRAVLESYGGELATLYQSERTFHYRLQADGHRMLCEPRAQLAHVNISIPRDVFTHAFIGGALFGQYRSAGMSRAAKLARTVLAPLVPPIRFWRMARTLGVRQLLSADMWCPVFLLAPVLLVAHASGEVAGYWRVVRHVEARYERFELRRLECVREDERPSLIAGYCFPDAEESRRSSADADAQSVRAGRSRSL